MKNYSSGYGCNGGGLLFLPPLAVLICPIATSRCMVTASASAADIRSINIRRRCRRSFVRSFGSFALPLIRPYVCLSVEDLSVGGATVAARSVTGV
jgi:hypothetical protein